MRIADRGVSIERYVGRSAPRSPTNPCATHSRSAQCATPADNSRPVLRRAP